MSFSSLFKSQKLTQTQVTQSLWSLSWVGFLSSVATMMVVSIYSVYLTEIKGATHAQAGYIEGVALFLSFLFKGLSGGISDIFRQRKPLIFLGGFLTVLVKLIFAAAHTVSILAIARVADRTIKGIRSSPTDALVADLSYSKVNRGRSYGIYKALGMIGVVVGSLLTMGLLSYTNRNYHLIFYLAMIPGIFSLILLVFKVQQPIIPNEIKKPHKGWHIQDIAYLPKEFWITIGIVFILMFARFSESFIIFRSRAVGWPVEFIPVLNIVMELTAAFLIYPVGRLADQSNRWVLLLRGMAMLLLANVVFMSMDSFFGIVLGTILAGASVGMTQGIISALIADSAPAELRGTAFAIYYCVIGVSLLIGNAVAGELNILMGTKGCFAGGFVFTSFSMLILWYMMMHHQKKII